MYAIDRYYKIIRLLPPVLKNIVVGGIYYYLNFILRNRTVPARIIFFVTNRCNFDCGHCFYAACLNNTANELSCEEIRRFIRPISNKVLQVNITGGEPFLRNDLIGIANILYEAGIYNISLNTNGFFSDRISSFVAAAIKNKRLRIHFNLSYHSDIYNIDADYRKRFDETFAILSAWEKKRRKVSVQILFTVSSKNITEIKGLFNKFPGEKVNINLFRDYQKCVWGVPDAVRSKFTHLDKSHLCLSPQRIDELITVLKGHNLPDSLYSTFLFKKLEYSKKIMRTKKRYLDCYAGRLEGVIYPDGEVAFCELSNPIGNIKEYNYDLRALWNSQIAAERRKVLSSCACLSSCNLKLAILKDRAFLRNFFLFDNKE